MKMRNNVASLSRIPVRHNVLIVETSEPIEEICIDVERASPGQGGIVYTQVTLGLDDSFQAKFEHFLSEQEVGTMSNEHTEYSEISFITPEPEFCKIKIAEPDLELDYTSELEIMINANLCQESKSNTSFENSYTEQKRNLYELTRSDAEEMAENTGNVSQQQIEAVPQTLLKCLNELRRAGCLVAWKVIGRGKKMAVNVNWNTNQEAGLSAKRSVRGFLSRSRKARRTPAYKKNNSHMLLVSNGNEPYLFAYAFALVFVVRSRLWKRIQRKREIRLVG